MLEFRNVSKVFRQGWLKKTEIVAVKEVSLLIKPGKIFGLMGESGSGKSTLGKLALGLLTPSAGEVLWEGRLRTNLRSLPKEARLAIQGISQNPYGVFNPRHRIGYALAEPLIYHGLLKNEQERLLRIREILELVNMEEDCLRKYPSQLSGGQLQRLALARILLMNPKLIVADEPTTMLDLTTQAQIIHLLKRIHEKKGVAILFISHDLPVVTALAQRIGIMYGGRLVEVGSTQEILTNPLHPYTQLFLAAAREEVVPELQSNTNNSKGCIYYGSCYQSQELCAVKTPELIPVKREHLVACHLVNAAKNG